MSSIGSWWKKAADHRGREIQELRSELKKAQTKNAQLRSELDELLSECDRLIEADRKLKDFTDKIVLENKRLSELILQLSFKTKA